MATRHTLPEAMTGRASPAKTAVGDKPVFADIASLPQPHRAIAEAVDALAPRTLPGLTRSVDWGMSHYGVCDLDESQVAAWTQQVTSVPGLGVKKR